MPTFTVQSVEQAASGGEGEKAWTRQKLSVLAADGVTPQTVTFFCNKWQPVPAVGATIDGDIEAPKQEGWTPELKVPRRGGGGGSKDFKADPVKQAAIAMEHSQKAAIDILTLAAVHAEDYRLPEKVSEIAEQVRLVAKSLYAQITEVSEAAK